MKTEDLALSIATYLNPEKEPTRSELAWLKIQLETHAKLKDLAYTESLKLARDALDKLSVTETFALLQGDRVRALKEALQLIASGPPSFAKEIAKTALARDEPGQ